MSFEYRKQIEDLMECDVLVAGAGPSGFAAALAAARNGARTLLVERCGFPGGMATAALVGPFMTCYDGAGEVQIIRGIFDELVRRLEKKGGAIHPEKVGGATPHAAFIKDGHAHVTPFNSELLKCVMEEMLLEAGVNALFYTQFLDAPTREGRIERAVVAKKQGLCAIDAKVYVDCTGDADVAAAAGVETWKGERQTGEMQPGTLFFRVCNVDSPRVVEAIEQHRDQFEHFAGAFSWIIREGRKAGEWTIQRDEMGTYLMDQPDEWKLNTTRLLGVDGTRSEDLTSASIKGRRQVQQVYRFLRAHIPGFERAKLMDTGSVLGIRETRHISGRYTITREDLQKERAFEDAIVLCANAIDIHSNTGERGEYVTIRNAYQIPYRCLLPVGVDNLIVSGRSISAEAQAAAAFRVMPPCFGLGQAAGTAAALCVQHSAAPAALNTQALRAKLQAQDVYLGTVSRNDFKLS